MIGRVGTASAGRHFGPRGSMLSATVLGLAIFAVPQDRAAAQLSVQSPQTQGPQAQSPQPAAAPAAPEPIPAAQASPPPAQKEGFFDALGKWWDKSAADWDSG